METAIRFLENPKVVGTPLAHKQNFLQRKGLTEKEIQAACERSGSYQLHEQQQTRQIIPYQPHQLQLRPTLFDRVKDIVQGATIVGALAYAVYMLYRVNKIQCTDCCKNSSEFLFLEIY